MFLAYLGCFFCGLAVKNSILLILHFYLMGRDRICLVKTRRDIGTRQERSFETIQDWETQFKTSQDFKPLWNLDSTHDKTFKISRRDETEFPVSSRNSRQEISRPTTEPLVCKDTFQKFRQINYFYCLFYLLKRQFHRIYGKHYDKNENF